MRRSLLVWGWGQLAAGDRRGWLGPPAQVAAVAALGLAAPLAGGTSAPLVFVLAALVGAAWLLVAAHAWHAAARRRALHGLDPGGGAAGLLLLVPYALVLGGGFWIAAGPGTDPGLTLEAYVGDWRAGRLEAGLSRFAEPPGSTTTLRERWERQGIALRNALVRIVAAEPGARASPERPVESLRWVDLGPTSGGGRRFAAEVEREETQRDLLFGVLPTTARRLVPVERVGTAELRPVATPAPGPLSSIEAWRVVWVEVAGERVGG